MIAKTDGGVSRPHRTPGPSARRPTAFHPGDPLAAALGETRDWLLDRQHDDGYWVGELEGDTILESEYILLMTFLGRQAEEVNARLAL